MTADKVIITDKKTKEKKEMPYGVCVWSTGVAPIPLTKQFMAQVPEQGKGYKKNPCYNELNKHICFVLGVLCSLTSI